MPIQESKYIWRNGEFVDWADATTHLLTQGLHYGSSAWEGLRAYDTEHKRVCIFRHREHIERLFYSARVYRIPIDFTVEEVMQACRDVMTRNELRGAYIRPIAYLGYGELGMAAPGVPHEIAIAAFPFGAYLGEDGMSKGVDVAVSSWRRPAPSTVPTGVKAGGNYLSSRLISLEAKQKGYAEGIGLTHDGKLSEGAGENLFVVSGGKIYTPPASDSILAGITRDAVMTLASDLGFDVIEQSLAREFLYGADEAFLTGTAADITPIASCDGLPIGTGEWPITNAIQSAFFGLFSGKTEDKWGWLDPAYTEQTGEAANAG